MFIPDEKLRAPELRGIEWLNTPPISLASLRGKRVVLIDFWDYTCINCLHTLPYLKAWHTRYAPYGLMAIGLHAPEFSFAKTETLVEKAMETQGLTYPIGLDNDFSTWNAFANRCWPAKYLIDAEGYLRAYHFGEGAYGEFEQMIQTLLKELRPDAAFPPLLPPQRPIDRPGALCYRPTPEMYLGYQRGELGNREGNPPESTIAYMPPPEQQFLDTVYLEGAWVNRKECVQTVSIQPARIHLNYRAAEVNLVMNAINEPVTLILSQDGAPLAQAHWGTDVYLSEGQAAVQVTEPRMYRLIQNPGFETHRLTLAAQSEGFQAYAFTFVSCVSEESALA